MQELSGIEVPCITQNEEITELFLLEIPIGKVCILKFILQTVCSNTLELEL